MSAKVIAAENFMNDVVSFHFSNLSQAIKKKEESVWGPLELRIDEKHFTTQEACPGILKSESANVETEINIRLSSPSELFPRDSKANEFGVLAQNNTDNSAKLEMAGTERIIRSDNSDKQSKIILEESLKSSHFRNKNRLPSDIKLFDEDYCVDFQEQLGNNMSCSFYGEEEMPSKFQNMNLASSINSHKKQSHIIGGTAGAKNDFSNWCEIRRKEYESRSNLNQPNASLDVDEEFTPEAFLPWSSSQNCPKPIAHTSIEIPKDISKQKSFCKNESADVLFESKIMSEDVLVVINNTLPKKDVDVASNRERDLNNEKSIECTEYCDPMCPKIIKVEDKILEDCSTLKNNSLLSAVKMFNDQDNMSSREHHNTNHKSQVFEKLKESITVEPEELSKFHKFSTKKDEINGLKNKGKKLCFKSNQDKFYDQSFRSTINLIEKGNKNSRRQSVKEAVGRKMNRNNCHDSYDSSFNSISNNCSSNKESNILCVKISDEKYERNFEFMADSNVILRIKRTSPGLSADIPEVDSGYKKLNYSADAINILLRLVFCQSLKVIQPSAVIGVEVLAAAQSWKVENYFFKLFQENFFKNVLTPNNASVVFSHANFYDLKDVCSVCKDISLNAIAQNTTAFKKRQKNCFVSISTYIKPLEICIPFETAENEFSTSFVKQIRNKFTFKAISGYYSITGFQIQLNEKLLTNKIGMENDKSIFIDYSIKNLNGNKEMEIFGREKKPLRSINIIYFRRNLIIKPKELGEIVIETEIEPYFCSVHEKKKALIKTSVGELDLMMDSNWKIENSDRKIILVKKFFYHVIEAPKN